jgi:quercetin dioxygenase-like cupin family protein
VRQPRRSSDEEGIVFYKADSSGYNEVVDGVWFKTLVHGERTLLSRFRLEKGASVPTHQHPHEQTGYLVSGCLRFAIGDGTVEAEAGDSWSIPGDVPHAAEALEESIVIEVFSPVREEYLP